METTIRISEIERDHFRSLLLDLEADFKHVSIKLELNGEMWTEKFCNVLVFSRQELILNHLPTRSIQYIKDVSIVTAFEIDQPCSMLEPYKRYRIGPVSHPFVRGLSYG
jgi:hypothetical protein